MTKRLMNLIAFLERQQQERNIPGLAVALLERHEVLLQYCQGMANVASSTPVTPNTTFEIGSITKTLTAAAIMKLVEQGIVRLDDPLCACLPDTPRAWERVTLRHLLSHQSGIKDYTEEPSIEPLLLAAASHQEILSMVSAAPLEFEPGAQKAYSNLGFILLGMVIDSVSQKEYAQFLNDHIFTPLQMPNTQVSDGNSDAAGRAYGYQWDTEGWLPVPSVRTRLSCTSAAGILVSSLSDMVKYSQALETEQLLLRASKAQMWTRARCLDGQETDKGLGWGVDYVDGFTIIGHGGSVAGFECRLSRFPDHDLAIIVLSNLERSGTGQLARECVKFYLAQANAQ